MSTSGDSPTVESTADVDIPSPIAAVKADDQASKEVQDDTGTCLA